MTQSRMVAWACVNAIMAFIGEPEVPYGEWHRASGNDDLIDPVRVAKLIVAWRK